MKIEPRSPVRIAKQTFKIGDEVIYKTCKGTAYGRVAGFTISGTVKVQFRNAFGNFLIDENEKPMLERISPKNLQLGSAIGVKFKDQRLWLSPDVSSQEFEEHLPIVGPEGKEIPQENPEDFEGDIQTTIDKLLLKYKNELDPKKKEDLRKQLTMLSRKLAVRKIGAQVSRTGQATQPTPISRTQETPFVGPNIPKPTTQVPQGNRQIVYKKVGGVDVPHVRAGDLAEGDLDQNGSAYRIIEKTDKKVTYKNSNGTFNARPNTLLIIGGRVDSNAGSVADRVTLNYFKHNKQSNNPNSK